jgi:glycosyltransferase involved in cell wall biosynthesis
MKGMKVLQVPFCFHPDPVGGTEVYVAALARQLEASGVTALIAAPGKPTRYVHEGLRVWRFPVGPGTGDPRDVYDEGDPESARAFGAILDAEGPDVVHLHALTRGVSLRLLREAARRGVATVFTYHTPTVSCTRGTLLQWGSQVCDGTMAGPRCSACTLEGLGLGRAMGAVLGRMPRGFGRMAQRAGLAGGAWTALRMSELVSQRHEVVRSFLREVDRVVVLCRWTRDLLLRNGVAAAKVRVSPHGLAHSEDGRLASVPRPERTGPLRVAYLGRLDPTKGVDVLVRAVREAPTLAVELDVYGVVQGSSGEAYVRRLDALAAGDHRIRFHAPVTRSAVIPTIARHDLLAVPSQWLETGPFVVLEAFAAGVPVLGSDLGGIAELVCHAVDGILVERASRRAWSDALARLAGDPGLLARLKAGVRPPRRMEAVAWEMHELYRELLSRSSPQLEESTHAPA